MLWRTPVQTDELASRIQKQTGLTSVGIGMSIGNSPLEVSVAGRRRRNGLEPVTTADYWHIGSIGKSVTALLIASLFEHCSPKLDCKLSSIFPDLNVNPGWKECTLYHLLTGTSGLPGNFPLAMLRIQEKDGVKLAAIRREFVQKALSKAPKSKCGSAFLYSNLGYSLLGHIAETKTDTPFEQLLIERIMNPLSLGNAGFGAPKGETANDQPMGHRVLLGYKLPVDPFKGVSDNPTLITPAGRLHMSLQDMLNYGRIHLEGERGENFFLKPDTWELLHKPFLGDYGCGWVCQEKEWANGRLIWHNGSNNLWYALLLLIPEHDCVLAFTTNDGAVKKAEKTFFDAAQEILASF